MGLIKERAERAKRIGALIEDGKEATAKVVAAARESEKAALIVSAVAVIALVIAAVALVVAVRANSDRK